VTFSQLSDTPQSPTRLRKPRSFSQLSQSSMPTPLKSARAPRTKRLVGAEDDDESSLSLSLDSVHEGTAAVHCAFAHCGSSSDNYSEVGSPLQLQFCDSDGDDAALDSVHLLQALSVHSDSSLPSSQVSLDQTAQGAD
jgi:hypothetical protein